MRRGSWGLLVGSVVGGAVLGACSSSATSPTISAPSTSSTGSPVSTARTVPSATTSPPTTAAGPAPCAAAGLSGTVAASSGAAGTIETTVALRSTAAKVCTMGGYPGLLLLGAAGTGLPTNVVRKGNYGFTAMAPTTVTLSPGATAYFNIGYSDVPVGGETTCPSSASLEVTPPNAYDHLVVAATLAPCGGGTLVVSPVFPATGSDSRTTAPPGG